MNIQLISGWYWYFFGYIFASAFVLSILDAIIGYKVRANKFWSVIFHDVFQKTSGVVFLLLLLYITGGLK